MLACIFFKRIFFAGHKRELRFLPCVFAISIGLLKKMPIIRALSSFLEYPLLIVSFKKDVRKTLKRRPRARNFIKAN